VHEKRREADVGADPARTLERRALATAGRATGVLPQNIAGRVGAPADHGDGTRKRGFAVARDNDDRAGRQLDTSDFQT